MIDEQAIEKVVEALLAPLRDVGAMLAQEIDKTNKRIDALEQRIPPLALVGRDDRQD
jgi:vacuolar-type H+-ATPase subunit D/Vma8